MKLTTERVDNNEAAEKMADRLRFDHDCADSRLEELEGHRYEVAEPSPSGKMGFRCAACGLYTNNHIKARFDPCPRSPYAQLQDTRDQAEYDRDQLQAALGRAVALIGEVSDLVSSADHAMNESLFKRVDAFLSDPLARLEEEKS